LLTLNTDFEKIQALKQNLNELMRAFLIIHKSTLGFSWKKMWPFRSFLPQVDFIRNAKLCGEVEIALKAQQEFCHKILKAPSSTELHGFLEALNRYIPLLIQAVQNLKQINQLYQKREEKNPEFKIRVFNQGLKNYEHATHKYTALAGELGARWAEYEASAKQ
jgi:hypothetical protein